MDMTLNDFESFLKNIASPVKKRKREFVLLTGTAGHKFFDNAMKNASTEFFLAGRRVAAKKLLKKAKLPRQERKNVLAMIESTEYDLMMAELILEQKNHGGTI